MNEKSFTKNNHKLNKVLIYQTTAAIVNVQLKQKKRFNLGTFNKGDSLHRNTQCEENDPLFLCF